VTDATPAPQLITALAGVVGVLVGSIISWLVQARLLGRRIKADEALAQRKFDFDKEIAERKFRYDRELHDHKRRTELAEQALTAVYEARGVFVLARSRGIFGNEGSSRKQEIGETKTQQEKRNTYFIPIERLTREKALFARIHSLRYSFAAHFNDTAAEPFNAILKAYNEIISTAGILIELTHDDSISGAFEMSTRPLLDRLGWGTTERPDDIDRAIEKAVQDIEKSCRPILSATQMNSLPPARQGS